MIFYLGGWCCVDVVEESLEIVAGKRTVHLLVRPCMHWFSVRYLTKMLIAMMIDHNGGDYTEDDDEDGDDSDDDDYLPPGRHPPAG